MLRPLRVAVPQRRPDRERGGQEVFADAACTDGKLPTREQEREQRHSRPILAAERRNFRHARRATNLFIAFVPLISCPHISVRLTNAVWPVKDARTRRGSSVKLSLCNEVIRELAFDRQCALAASLGYRGLELAPFTFGEDAWRMPAARRAETRRVCSDAGIEVSGLHWLLVAPAGLSITTSDRAVWRKSVDVLRASVDLCAELGGSS